MPPKPKFTKQQVVDTAYEIVRTGGIACLTARNLAKKLGTSTAPIFTLFGSIDEIENRVLAKATECYNAYAQKGLQEDPPFKGFGMKYIEFAKEEPELFKFLFMTDARKDTVAHFLPSYDDNADAVLKVLSETYGMSLQTARKLYNHMAVYAFGFASLFAQKLNVFTMEDISRMISEVFVAMIKNEKEDEIECLQSKI